jgi:hypothetical protein
MRGTAVDSNQQFSGKPGAAAMAGIRLRRGEISAHLEAAPPILQPRCLGGAEFSVGDRPHFDRRPPGERKSGMPDSVEMPAPVSATIRARRR